MSRALKSRGLRKKRRLQLVIASMVALGVATTLIGYALQDGIQFFKTPTDIVNKPPKENSSFRVGGMVEPGSLVRNGTELSFTITDGENTIDVSYSGIVPDLFSEGQGTIATGALSNGKFVATEILAKHDETYMPSELAEMNLPIETKVNSP